MYLYEGLSFRAGNTITDWRSLAEYKADFDMALDAVGFGKWRGIDVVEFKYYRHFGKYQRAVIADILEVSDKELTRLGFYDIFKLKHIAYSKMCRYLNEGVING